MTLQPGPGGAAPPRLAATCDEVERELRRVVDRLGHLSVDRLAHPAPPWPSRGRAVRDTAQRLAGIAQGIEQAATVRSDSAGQPPLRRRIPALADHAAADMLAVTGADLLRAARAVAPGTPVWCDDVPVPVEDAVRRGAEALVALRQAV